MKKTLFFLLLVLASFTARTQSECGTISLKEAQANCSYGTRLGLRVFLDYVDPNTCLMNDYLRTLPSFPTTDPYWFPPLNRSFRHYNSFTAEVSDTVLAQYPIVDWVFIELYEGGCCDIPGACPSYTRAALLLNNGNIVDMDGTSPVLFPCTPPGQYHIAIRHRNHLTIASAQSLQVPGSYDFTRVPLCNEPQTTKKSSQICNELRRMLGGDANFDNSIDAFDTIIWGNENGLFDDYTTNADYNLDGSVDAFDTIIWEENNGNTSPVGVCDSTPQNCEGYFGRMAPPTVRPTSKKSITIAPNPASSEVTVQFTEADAQERTLTICALDGVVVHSENITTFKGQNTVTIAVNHLPKGFYLVQWVGSDDSGAQKLIIE